ncbi:MAG: hypothetical protein Q8M22_03580 [Actinomycetota bacterium]|nr:hypothetical protein [Actinomycetota bacterium]
MIRGLLAIAAIFLISTFPATWLLICSSATARPIGLSYWGALPLGILVSTLITGAGSSTVYHH